MASVPEETSSPEGSIQATGQAANQVASQVPHTFTKVRATELKAVPFGETDEQSGQEKVLLPQDKLDGQVVFPHPKPQVAASLAPTLDVVEVELPPEPKVKKDAVPPPLTPEELNSKLLRPAGPVIAGQTLMATPINIDQTQMHQSMKMSDNKPEKKTVTIQDLNVNYEKLTFMSPLEIVYYKLLRGALKQYLIFPRVSTSAVVKVNSAETEHKKIADNVLNSTNLSFIVCDVRLNIKAIVEVVDENEIPTNKDKARDYILKKAGCLLVRFYSGDKPPDVETLRLQIIGSL
jgi:hypothetical protein